MQDDKKNTKKLPKQTTNPKQQKKTQTALYKMISSCYDTINNTGKYTLSSDSQKKNKKTNKNQNKQMKTKKTKTKPTPPQKKKQNFSSMQNKCFSLSFSNKPVQKDFSHCWK